MLAALSSQPYRVTELAAREGISQPGVTQLVNRLERRNLVERRTDPQDGRVVVVAITDDGGRELDRVRAEYRALLHEEIRRSTTPRSRRSPLRSESSTGSSTGSEGGRNEGRRADARPRRSCAGSTRPVTTSW